MTFKPMNTAIYVIYEEKCLKYRIFIYLQCFSDMHELFGVYTVIKNFPENQKIVENWKIK